jgi:hypothetical protein
LLSPVLLEKTPTTQVIKGITYKPTYNLLLAALYVIFPVPLYSTLLA